MSKGNRAAKNSTRKNNTKKNGAAWLPNTLYVISALIAVVFVYMMIVNIMYIQNYLASYGMAFSDMWMDSIQYILTGSISYLVYAILVFCAGKLISMVGAGKTDASGERTDSNSDEALTVGKAKEQLRAPQDAEFAGAQQPVEMLGEAKAQDCEPQEEAGAQADAGMQSEEDSLHSDEDEAAKADLRAKTTAVEADVQAEEESQADADASPSGEKDLGADADASSAGDEPQEKVNPQADTNA